jgi:hypothetical protein
MHLPPASNSYPGEVSYFHGDECAGGRFLESCTADTERQLTATITRAIVCPVKPAATFEWSVSICQRTLRSVAQYNHLQ